MRIATLIALSTLSLAVAAPVAAEDAMMKDGMKSGAMMKMSASDKRKMKACNAMPHAKMMKNARCAKMMKMHPSMMKHDAMMKAH